MGGAKLLQSPATTGVLQTSKHFGVFVLAVLQHLYDTHYSVIHCYYNLVEKQVIAELRQGFRNACFYNSVATLRNAYYKNVCVQRYITRDWHNGIIT